MVNQAKRWVFTLNNYTDDNVLAITSLPLTLFEYLCFGKEVGESGTPHLQGYVMFVSPKSLNQVRQVIGAHWIVSRGTPLQASAYCKKDGDFFEAGALPIAPVGQGKRNDLDLFLDWVKDLVEVPTPVDLMTQWPRVMARYSYFAQQALSALGPKPLPPPGEPREWQVPLLECLQGVANDRTITFVVDPDGNNGKTWLQKYLLATFDDVQLLLMGKRDDMTFSVDTSKRVFLLNCPRDSSEFLQYTVLEMIKDGIVHSPKYNSVTKLFHHKCHVVVFMNEFPLMTKLTADRYNVIRIGQPAQAFARCFNGPPIGDFPIRTE